MWHLLTCGHSNFQLKKLEGISITNMLEFQGHFPKMPYPLHSHKFHSEGISITNVLEFQGHFCTRPFPLPSDFHSSFLFHMEWFTRPSSKNDEKDTNGTPLLHTLHMSKMWILLAMPWCSTLPWHLSTPNGTLSQGLQHHFYSIYFLFETYNSY